MYETKMFIEDLLVLFLNWKIQVQSKMVEKTMAWSDWKTTT